MQADYHSRPELSSSEVAAYLSDPLDWYYRYVARTSKFAPTDAMKLGTVIHKMSEYGGWEGLAKDIPAEVLNKDGHCKGKAWTEWKAANPSDAYIKPSEPNKLRIIWEHLQANSWCRDIIANSEKEVEHFWQDDDLDRKCRMKADAICGNILVDWKTTTKPDTRQFAMDCVYRHYPVRMALYARGFRDRFGVEPVVYIVAINTSGGYKVTPYQIPRPWLEDAEAQLIMTVDEMSRFSLSRYLDRAPEVLEQPRWAGFNLEVYSND